MRNLLKSDLKRIFKDKLFIIVCIIGVVFAIASPLLYKTLFASLNLEEELNMIVNAKSLFFTAFLPGDNFGLILPIFIAIILCKDFTYGTVRNKIICGKSRKEVFLSSFLACAIVLSVVMVAHAVLTLLISLCFFPYQETAFQFSDFLYLLESFLLEILVYCFIAALVSFLSVFMKKTGATIVALIALNFILSLVGGILQISLEFISPANESYQLIHFLTKINLFSGSILGKGVSYSFADLLYVILPALGGCAVFIGLGMLVFHKKDLK